MKILEDYHAWHYLVLVLGLGAFIALLVVFSYSTPISIVISFLGSLFYVLWGIIHHALEKRLYKEIVLEYVLIGLSMFLLLALVKMY